MHGRANKKNFFCGFPKGGGKEFLSLFETIYNFTECIYSTMDSLFRTPRGTYINIDGNSDIGAHA